MDKINKLPSDFFTKTRDSKKVNNEKRQNDDYSKIEEIKWNKDILSGKNKIVGTLPKNN